VLRKICSASGCSRLTEGNQKYCSLHQYLQVENDRKRAEYFASANHNLWQDLYNSKDWKNLRAKVLEDSPVCQKCGLNQATEVHHIIPHKGDLNLFLDPNNLAALCHSCHCEETRKEAQQRGKEASQEYWKRKRQGKLWY